MSGLWKPHQAERRVQRRDLPKVWQAWTHGCCVLSKPRTVALKVRRARADVHAKARRAKGKSSAKNPETCLCCGKKCHREAGCPLTHVTCASCGTLRHLRAVCGERSASSRGCRGRSSVRGCRRRSVSLRRTPGLSLGLEGGSGVVHESATVQVLGPELVDESTFTNAGQKWVRSMLAH